MNLFSRAGLLTERRKLLPGATETISSPRPDQPLPAKLVKQLVQARLVELATGGKKLRGAGLPRLPDLVALRVAAP